MTNPTLVTTPFAENGDKNIIPESVGSEPQNATMQAGFPPITQQKISEGGIPPERNDFNGILNLYGQHIVHLNKGLQYRFDQAFADSIGGYPLDSRIALDDGDIVRSIIPNNTNNPNLDMTGWLNEAKYLESLVIYGNYNVVSPENLKDYVARMPIQAILKTDGTDETVNFKAYVAKAKELNVPLILPSGVILISDTILLDFTIHLCGSGRDRTVIRFRNTVQDKLLFSFVRGGTKSVFKDITFQEETLYSSIGTQFKDSISDTGTPLWKCSFYNCEWIGFNVALKFTSNNPLSGTTHAHCSENLFVHCKFSANKRWIHNQNCQAVNNMFLKCEVENSDTNYLNGQTIVDNNFEFIVDEAGGGFVLEGGSYIGRGRMVGWRYPTGGTNLFSGSGTFAGHDMRLECRANNGIPHYGCLFEEITGGLTGVSMHYDLNVTNMKPVVYGATLDLLRFSGRMSGYFNNVGPVGGFGLLNVRHYPTLGRSATDSTGSLASVILDCCTLVRYIKDTTSPFGTYNANYTSSVEFRGTRSTSPNSTFANDAQGWAVMTGGGDVNQLAFQYSNVQSFSKLIYNRDWTSSGLPASSQLKVRMPSGGRPMKLFCYKNPTNMNTDHTFTLYLVKDNANWADPANFNIATDAFSCAVTPSSLNNAGMFEVSVRIPTTALGSPLISGQGSWLEGRMLIVNNGSTSFSGFVGIEYG